MVGNSIKEGRNMVWMCVRKNDKKWEKKVVEGTQDSSQIFFSIREKVLDSAQGNSLIYESFVKGFSLICGSCTGPPYP